MLALPADWQLHATDADPQTIILMIVADGTWAGWNPAGASGKVRGTVGGSMARGLFPPPRDRKGGRISESPQWGREHANLPSI